eukprot:177573-Pyramimonas_sp.AAC.1
MGYDMMGHNMGPWENGATRKMGPGGKVKRTCPPGDLRRPLALNITYFNSPFFNTLNRGNQLIEFIHYLLPAVMAPRGAVVVYLSASVDRAAQHR